MYSSPFLYTRTLAPFAVTLAQLQIVFRSIVLFPCIRRWSPVGDCLVSDTHSSTRSPARIVSCRGHRSPLSFSPGSHLQCKTQEKPVPLLCSINVPLVRECCLRLTSTRSSPSCQLGGSHTCAWLTSNSPPSTTLQHGLSSVAKSDPVHEFSS